MSSYGNEIDPCLNKDKEPTKPPTMDKDKYIGMIASLRSELYAARQGLRDAKKTIETALEKTK